MEGNPAASAAINNELKMLLEEGELCQEVGGGWDEALQFTGHHHCHHHYQRQTDHHCHNDHLDIIKIDIEVEEQETGVLVIIIN